MDLLIGIPTYRRIPKLTRCLNSIYRQDPAINRKIVVIADNNDRETVEYIQNLKLSNTNVIVQPKHMFVIGAWNRVISENINKNWDGFIGLCDDIELYDDALKNIVECHKNNFPDTDGVVGFKQVCENRYDYSFKWFGQTLIGRKFIERYRFVNYAICCQDYFHFCQDEELFIFANSLNKFKDCENAIMNHYHPAFIPSEIDETHNIIRSGPLSPKEKDFKMFKKRQKLGYCWGNDFNLVGREKE